jgi:hypothetical protein
MLILLTISLPVRSNTGLAQQFSAVQSREILRHGLAASITTKSSEA